MDKWQTLVSQVPEETQVALYLDQVKSVCDLDHPKEVGPRQAIDTLCIETRYGLLSFHVCDICAPYLDETPKDGWYLFICFKCMATKWVHEDFLKSRPEKTIQKVDSCPCCSDM